MTALTDLLDAHHKKLNEHTEKINKLNARLAEVEARLERTEGKGEKSLDFVNSVSRWVQTVKERLSD